MHVLLGRAAGLDEEKLAHLGDDPLPDGLYTDEEAAIVRFSQRSTRMLPLDDAAEQAGAGRFDTQQLSGLCFAVGLSNMVSRFRATFLTDLDPWTRSALGPA